MKSIRKKLKLFSVFSSVIILFFNCLQYDDVNNFSDSNKEINHHLNKKRKSHTGEDLFKSIFFGIGDFSKNIDLLKENSSLASNLSSSKKFEVNNKVNKVIESIKSENSNFFDDFKRKIESGNHILIEKCLQEGSSEIKKNIDIFFPNISEKISIIEKDISKRNLKLENVDEMNKYIENIQSSNLNDELLSQNMITSDGKEELIGAASVVWAVAAAIYFAVVAHNTIGATALIYYKAAFWGPKLKSSKIEKYKGAFSISRDSMLKNEILIDQIANYVINS